MQWGHVGLGGVKARKGSGNHASSWAYAYVAHGVAGVPRLVFADVRSPTRDRGCLSVTFGALVAGRVEFGKLLFDSI